MVDIKTIGDRIVCSDIQESVHFLKYRPLENQVSSTVLSQFTVTNRFTTDLFQYVAILNLSQSIIEV